MAAAWRDVNQFKLSGDTMLLREGRSTHEYRPLHVNSGDVTRTEFL